MLSLQVTVLQTVRALPLHPGCEPSLSHADAEIVADLSLPLFLTVRCTWPALARSVN